MSERLSPDICLLVSRFDGMTVDMDYQLNIPSVHAAWGAEEIVVDMGGTVRSRTPGFSAWQQRRLTDWVAAHREEVVAAHLARGQGEPVPRIDPPAEDPEQEDRVLDAFLRMPIASPDAVFDRFRSLPGAIEAHGDTKQGYLYIPGTRPDRCLLAAHADTYFDLAYMGWELRNEPVLEGGVYRGSAPDASIGADDRSGCAMLWLLRDLGHSLLIVDGEEHGQIGSRFLMQHDPALFTELNAHSFILQLDRRGSRDLRFYDLPVTEDFVAFIREQTGFEPVSGPGRTDIVALCRDVCGVNLSVGYYGEHRSYETLAVEEWRHTLHLVRDLLAKPQRRYPLRRDF